MQELEKILYELEKRIFTAEVYNDDFDGITITNLICLGDVMDILEKHMNDGWIPVECKLPKTNGIYNVARRIDGHFISDSSYFDGQNTWHSDNRVNHSRPYLTDVIAWQPLPEPYRPERSDNNDRK